MTLKVIFAGTPEFAKGILSQMIHSSFQPMAVYTQPDRPSGRGQSMKASPVKELALLHQIPVFQPVNFRDEFERQRLRDFHADIMVVTAYGLLLPKSVLEIFPYGAINIHPSLLPRWRGATPIQSALLAGDEQTGVTIMQMIAKMDAGPILLKKSTAIEKHETSGQLHQRLMNLGGEALLTVLNSIPSPGLQPLPQDEALSTHTYKIQKSDAQINWQNPAIKIEQMIRAFNPWPVAFTYFGGKDLRIFKADAFAKETSLAPGALVEIHKDYLHVATGSGLLRIWQVQLPGKQPISAADFINSQRKNLILGKTLFEEKR